MAVAKYKDPVLGWGDIGGQGPLGITGPTGPTGPVGPTGPTGLGRTVIVDPVQPVIPVAELWYDTDEPAPVGAGSLPLGGTPPQALVKTAVDHGWADLLPLSGGTIDGDLVVTGNATTGTLIAPQIAGDVWFDNDTTANAVTDRTGYGWEQWDVEANLPADWYSDGTLGPCKAWRNRYDVLVNLSLRRRNTFVENAWVDVVTLPPGWRPGADLWDTRMATEGFGSGSLFQIQVLTSGLVRVYMLGNTLDWQGQTTTVVVFTYPRSDN